jgi:hypothetical protein
MGTLFWRPFGICPRTYRQMDHLAHGLEPLADEELREQVRVT